MSIGEGWHPDPFGRHEQRFHDGTRWAAYVRDGDAHGMDEPVPGATMAPPSPGQSSTGASVVTEFEDASRMQRSLLTESRLLVTGTQVLDATGSRLGSVRAATPARTGLAAVVRADRNRAERREVIDDVHGMLLGVERRVEAKRGVLVVTDPGGREIGRVHRTDRRTKHEHDVVAAGRPVGRLTVQEAPTWSASVTDIRGQQVARLSRDARSGDGTHLLEMVQPVEEPLRSLTLAAALALDLVLK